MSDQKGFFVRKTKARQCPSLTDTLRDSNNISCSSDHTQVAMYVVNFARNERNSLKFRQHHCTDGLSASQRQVKVVVAPGIVHTDGLAAHMP